MNLNRLHTVVFWTFLVFFLTTVASVLFFTFGYRFSFERGIFIYTGSVTIKSNPRSVNISLDGEPVPADIIHSINQSIHVTGIAPGEHFIRVEADGYLPWEKKVIIQSGISTEFWNIILPRTSYEQTSVADGDFIKAFNSSTRKYFALVGEKEGETTITVIERATGTATPVMSNRDYRFDREDGRNIEWSKDETLLLVPLRSRDGGGQSVFMIDRAAGTATNLQDISSVPDPENPRWHPDNDGTFFVLSHGSLLLIRPDTKDTAQRATTIAKNVSAYDLAGRFAAILDGVSGTISLIPFADLTTTNQEVLTKPLPGADHFTKPVLTMYDDRRIAVYDKGGEGFLWNDNGKLEPSIVSLGSSIEGAQFSDDGKKLLFFTANEVSVLFARDWDVQPTREDGEILQIARFSSPISEVQWVKNYEHILFSLGGELKLAELDNRDRRNIETILPPSGKVLRQVITLPAEDELYMIYGTGDTGPADFSFIGFPEPIGFFGQ